ncbi:DUF6319 family protein [Nocardia sp. NPDC049220]|uniref:DUF6319 family protein n=1 Tax=Nocardia sp. NPDC049220 TaxID=3155273 RepID=UPI0033DC04EE
MSPTRTKPQPLSDNEIRQIRTDIDSGRPPMVWFTATAVGVPEGRSGKVIALGDPTEDDFLKVKPTGSNDVLPFSPTEVTLTKPNRRTTTTAATRPTTPKQTKATGNDTTAVPLAIEIPPTPHRPAPTRPAKPVAVKPVAVKPAPSTETATPAPPPVTPAPAKPARQAREKNATPVRKAKTPEVTVSLAGSADGEWTVDVRTDKKSTVRALPMSGAAVAQVAKLLPPQVAEVVGTAMESARAAQRTKVEQLQAELEQARRLLDELSH